MIRFIHATNIDTKMLLTAEKYFVNVYEMAHEMSP